MAFNKEAVRTPAAIGATSFTGVDNPAGEPDQLLFEVQVLDSAGNVLRVISGDLIPHIDGTSPISVDEFVQFSAWMRAKAVAEIID